MMASMRHVLERLRDALYAYARRPMLGHWFGHHAAKILVASVVGWVAWLTVIDLATLSEWIVRPVTLLLLTGSMLAPPALLDHESRPCDKRISEMPLDASAMAQQWHRYLTIYHHERDHRYRWGLGTLAYLALIVGAWWAGMLPIAVAYPLVIVPQVFDSVVSARHSRVELYCPRCRRRGRGPRERWVSPSPAPVTAS